MKRIITFGTFDLLHYGHIRLLKRAAGLGDRLIVGVSTDALTLQKKGTRPFFNLAIRQEMLLALKYVDEVFTEQSLELKGDYITRYKAQVLAMGSDWTGSFDQFKNEHTEVVYLQRTPDVSSTEIRQSLVNETITG